MNNILEQMLERYDIVNEQDEINAMKEIIQEIILCGLSRSDFFDHAAFYGGTALRIFYGLNRFSEDLDFSLLESDKTFDLPAYFPYIEKEANAYGLNVTIIKKDKNKNSNILSAFLKGDTQEHLLMFFPKDSYYKDHILKDIKIKFEIDVAPPKGANYEFKYKLLPSPHQIRLYDRSSLFAGKIHAILCRNWHSRTKGRDLYDYIFYLSKNVSVNIELLKNKLVDSKILDTSQDLTLEKLKDLLNEKFKNIDYDDAKKDVIPFIKDTESLNLWSENFFVEITKNIEVEKN